MYVISAVGSMIPKQAILKQGEHLEQLGQLSLRILSALFAEPVNPSFTLNNFRL